MTAPEPTPLEAAGFAWWSVHMHVGTWADESPEMRAYYAEQAAKIVGPALAGDWLERVLGEHRPAPVDRLDQIAGLRNGCTCRHMRPETNFGRHVAEAVRAAAGVGL